MAILTKLRREKLGFKLRSSWLQNALFFRIPLWSQEIRDHLVAWSVSEQRY
jgi:hypothetical protein